MRTMKIGVIGAGLIGGTLASKLAVLGHQVKLANSKAPSTLTEFGGIDNLTTVWAADAVRDVDIVIISVPEYAIDALGAELAPILSENTIVIDTGNYYPVRDGRIPALDGGVPDSVWVSQILGRPVFKVFNNIAAPDLKKKGTPDRGNRVGLLVSGPDGDAKHAVFALVDQLGFEPVDGGPLEESWRQQPGTPAYCKDLDPDSLKASWIATVLDDVDEYHRNRDQIVDFDAAVRETARRMA
ncbi:NAD(P)-binding domain-containing protein [Nocardia sp. NPDC050378]|uniref:NADPH-dependent F420 reductase n=1 Tax=Nocardia sp. NPDC050378 TaxID=3155400 RepID=UPI0033C4F575